MSNINTIKNTLQQLLPITPKASVAFRFQDVSIILQTPSNTFDNYGDIYAQLLVITDSGEVLLNGLISFNTDLDALCAKIKKKIITNEIKQRSLQYEIKMYV